MVRTKRTRILPVGGLTGLLIGAVVVPAFLSIAVGVVALALSKQAVDIVVGVLILCFALSAVIGGFVAFGLIRRGARLATMQTDFVANVSHELRTPVAGIRLLAETLAMGRANDPERARELGELISTQAVRLESLVERILRWRRIEAGALTLELEVLPLLPILEEAVAPYRAALAGTTTIDIHADPILPPVRVDPSAIGDVLRNLVDNAVKFGAAAGPIEVLARAGDGEVVVEVRDQGPGIPKGERKRIFQRFYRVRVHPVAKQGAGLGLSMAKSIVNAHRGRLTVESEPGIGSTFILRLPASEAEPQAVTPGNSREVPEANTDATATSN